jgi:hypothetical protein
MGVSKRIREHVVSEFSIRFTNIQDDFERDLATGKPLSWRYDIKEFVEKQFEHVMSFRDIEAVAKSYGVFDKGIAFEHLKRHVIKCLVRDLQSAQSSASVIEDKRLGQVEGRTARIYNLS